MKTAEFLKQFNKHLRKLGVSRSERRQAVAYYYEMIDDMVADGMDESAAIDALGDPAEAAGNFVSEIGGKFAKKPRSSGKALRTAAIIIGSPLWITFLVVAAVILISVMVCLWSGIAGLWCGAAGFGAGFVGGIGGAIMCLFVPGRADLVIGFLGTGFICGGFCLLWILGMTKLTKLSARFTRWAFRTIFKRRGAK